MARWEVTIAQPPGAVDALPPVVLRTFGEDGYKPSIELSKTLAGRTIGGSGNIEGTVTDYIHSWELSVLVFEEEARQLEALIAWQQKLLGQRLDGRLLLTDEFEYTLPVFGTHPKTLLSGSTITVAPGCTTGFPICKVIMALPDQHKQHRGAKDDKYGKLISVIAVEVP